MKSSPSIIIEDDRFEYGHYRHLTGPMVKTNIAGTSVTPSNFGYHSVRGLRYRVRIELIGANPLSMPDPEDYMPNWAWHRDEIRAKHYFTSRSEQKRYPEAKAHMRAILKARKDGKQLYRMAIKAWKQALKLDHVTPIDWDKERAS